LSLPGGCTASPGQIKTNLSTVAYQETHMGKPNFKNIMTDFAETLEWDTSSIDKDYAEFEFETEDGATHTLWVTLLDDDVVEFDIPSAAVFERERDIPDTVATLLLKRNADLIVGAWAAEEYEEEWYLSLLWNVNLAELETMAHGDFEKHIFAMVEEVDEFDGIWEEDF
jgi:hypothetical protein